MNDSQTSNLLEADVRQKNKNTLMMNVYLLVHIGELFHESFNKAKAEIAATSIGGKKPNRNRLFDDTAMNWMKKCETMIRVFMNFFDLDIHRLWDPELVEDDFLEVVMNICYKIMESPTLVKVSSVKESVLHLLGCLLKKFNRATTVSLKVVQHLQHFPHLALPFAEAVALWNDTFKCKSIVFGLLREFNHIPDKELLRDTESTKTIGNFLVELAKQCPSAVLSNISMLLERLNEEPYSMRNAVLSVMGEIIIHNLSGEGLDKKAKLARDQFLDFLYDHANLDPNAFTRCRALQTLITVIRSQALPIKRYPDLVELCSSLLLDRSNLVRKFTVQLLETILRFNPFASKLPIDVLQAGLDEATEKLNQLNEKVMKDKAGDKSMQEDNASGDEESQDPEFRIDQENQSFILEEEGEAVVPQDNEDPELTKQKDIVSYLSNSVRFVQQFYAAVPLLCQLLVSVTHSDIIEAISFFTAAWEFKLSFAFSGVTEILQQIWNEDPKIRDAVVAAYKHLYFTTEGTSQRARASSIADSLMSLMISFSAPGKLKCLEALLIHLSKSGDVPQGLAQILWDRFSKPELNNSAALEMISTYDQQKLAVQLLGNLAKTDPGVIKNKIDILVEYGLTPDIFPGEKGPLRNVDFSLPIHTCKALNQLNSTRAVAGEYKKFYRLHNGQDMFSNVTTLIVKGFDKPSENWEHFCKQAMVLIYSLAECPDELCENIMQNLLSIVGKHESDSDTEMKRMLMIRVYFLCGEIILKQLVYLEVAVLSELKYRRKLKDNAEEVEKKKKANKERKSKTKKTDEAIEDDGGAVADDAEQEFVRNVVDTEILMKDNLLGMVAPMIVQACLKTLSVEMPDVALQATTSLALAKYMMVNSSFCESHLQLLFTIIQKSPHEVVRANLVIPIGDLCVRFPNLLEPWTAHLYARLKDESSLVRIYSLKVIANLILNDMVKVKGHVSEMARCAVDSNDQISLLAKKFFKELSKKGNSIYNVMPDIISRLSDPEVGVEDDEQFQVIMKFLFSFIQREKQSESLIEKLCHRFSASRTQRQVRDLAFCLSLLSYSEKSVRRLQENFICFADKLSDEQVYQSFNTIIVKSRKFCKPEIKAQVDELEALINDCHKKGVSDDQTAAKAAAVVKKSRRMSSIRSPRAAIAWPVRSTVIKRESSKMPAVKISKKRVQRSYDSDDMDEDFEDPMPSSTASRTQKITSVASQPDPPVARVTRRSTRLVGAEMRGRARVMTFSSDEEDGDSESIENIEISGPSSPNSSQDTTPIRRRKTLKKTNGHSMLRA